MSDTQVTWVDGMPPMQLLLLGAAGCSAMDVVHILKNRMRRPLTGLRIAVKSEQAAQHPKVYTRIELNDSVTQIGIFPALLTATVQHRRAD